MDKNQLPDTPFYISYLKKDEDDPRRHKARCIFYDDKKCELHGNCYGSAHCRDYSENLNLKKIYDERKKLFINLLKHNNNTISETLSNKNILSEKKLENGSVLRKYTEPLQRKKRETSFKKHKRKKKNAKKKKNGTKTE